MAVVRPQEFPRKQAGVKGFSGIRTDEASCQMGRVKFQTIADQGFTIHEQKIVAAEQTDYSQCLRPF